MTACELCERDVVSIVTGKNYGKPDDLCLDPQTALITEIILYGKLKLFGLLGREEDTVIPWKEIEKIGEDVILVRTEGNKSPLSHKNSLNFLNLK